MFVGRGRGALLIKNIIAFLHKMSVEPTRLFLGGELREEAGKRRCFHFARIHCHFILKKKKKTGAILPLGNKKIQTPLWIDIRLGKDPAEVS